MYKKQNSKSKAQRANESPCFSEKEKNAWKKIANLVLYALDLCSKQ